MDKDIEKTKNKKSDDEKIEHRKNIFSGIALLLFSIMILVLSIKMPRFDEHRSIYGAPGIVPGLLALSLIIMSLVLIYSGIKNGGLEIKFNINSGELSMENEKIRLLLFIILIGAYILLLLNIEAVYFMGLDFSYVIITTLFLFVSFIVYGWKKLVSGFLIALIFSIVIVYIFTNFFRVPLP